MFEPEVLEEEIAKPSSILAARAAMESVVTEGTAKNVFEGCTISVAGKTGTAHVAGGNVKYSDGVYLASFVGYFPADQPQYSCIVLIKTKPHAPQHYGGQLSAPVFREIAVRMQAQFLDQKTAGVKALKKDSSFSAFAIHAKDLDLITGELNLAYKNSGTSGNWKRLYIQPQGLYTNDLSQSASTMPDLMGMNLRDAIYLLENKHLRVSFSGRGKVRTQSIEPGSGIKKNQKVILELSE
jgi:cell division protein FtsI (penicillin-binding protein 3)